MPFKLKDDLGGAKREERRRKIEFFSFSLSPLLSRASSVPLPCNFPVLLTTTITTSLSPSVAPRAAVAAAMTKKTKIKKKRNIRDCNSQVTAVPSAF